jgi:hypothetical protein
MKPPRLKFDEECQLCVGYDRRRDEAVKITPEEYTLLTLQFPVAGGPTLGLALGPDRLIVSGGGNIRNVQHKVRRRRDA